MASHSHMKWGEVEEKHSSFILHYPLPANASSCPEAELPWKASKDSDIPVRAFSEEDLEPIHFMRMNNEGALVVFSPKPPFKYGKGGTKASVSGRAGLS